MSGVAEKDVGRQARPAPTDASVDPEGAYTYGSHPEDEKLSHSSRSDDEVPVEREGRDAVSRIEAVSQILHTYGARTIFGFHVAPLKVLLLILLFLQGYSSGLDGILSGSWQTYASNFFGQSAQSGSINTVKSVIAAAVLVPYARLSDRFGRVETWLLATSMFVIGRIVTAATPTFGGLFAGSIIWEFGYAGFRILATALTTDISGLRDRTFFMNIYLLPIIINLWVSGDIAQKMYNKGVEEWRWGYGMFAIIVPVVTLAFSTPYFIAQGVAKKRKTLPSLHFRKPNQGYGQALWDLIMDLDIVGVLLFAGLLCLILIPLTIAGGLESKWDRAYIIAMICVGGALIPVFMFWEYKYARAPFIPRRRLEFTFYAAMLLEFCWRLAISVELNQVRLILLVGFGESPKSAQRLGQLYDFMQSCTNVVVGIILHFWPHPKVFVFCGSLVGLLGMGLMYKYRTAYDGISGYIAGDVLIGMGGGMMRFPLWTLVHAGVPHEQMAVATGFMMTMYQVGAAVGSCVGTAVWTQKLAGNLVKELGPELGMKVYKSPLNFLKKFPIGSPTRDKILNSYAYIQHLLMIVSLSFAALVVVITLFVRNYQVGDHQAFTDEEREAERQKLKQSRFRWLKWVVGY